MFKYFFHEDKFSIKCVFSYFFYNYKIILDDDKIYDMAMEESTIQPQWMKDNIKGGWNFQIARLGPLIWQTYPPLLSSGVFVGPAPVAVFSFRNHTDATLFKLTWG